MRAIITCSGCGKTTELYALGQCTPCWYKQWKRQWRERNKEHWLAWSRTQQKRWRQANPEKAHAQSNRAYQKRKVKRQDILAERLGTICRECGENRTGALEYHHIKEKHARNYFSMSWEKFWKELPKLVVLCGTCHNLKHH